MSDPSDRCPWCGCDDSEVHRDTARMDYSIRCKSCGARGPAAVSPAMAIVLWRKRVEENR